MSTSDSLDALRKANPRRDPQFAAGVEAAATTLRTSPLPSPAAPPNPVRRRRLGPAMAGGGMLVAAAVAISWSAGWPGGDAGVPSAAAEVARAASATAATADQSGTATVRITHGGALWAGSTVRWNGADISVRGDAPQRPGQRRSESRIVDGVLYGVDPEGWLELGDPGNIDPGSGTPPTAYLAAVRADVGGETLRRITGGMTDLGVDELADGTTVYRGHAPSTLLVVDGGVKEGARLQMLPFGFVAHDLDARGTTPIDVAISVGPDGIVRELAASWGTGASAWRYVVTYSALGTTPAPVAPADAERLADRKAQAHP